MYMYIQINTMCVMKCVGYKHICNVSYRNLLMEGTEHVTQRPDSVFTDDC